MTRRALVLTILIVVFVIVLGVGAWAFFFSSPVPVDEPTPTPVESVGVLPTASADPFVTATPSVPPVAFVGVCPDTWTSQQDTDRDGLPDAVEASYGTDVNKQDSDDDGYMDGVEVRGGYEPMNSDASARLDSDSDNLRDDEECKWGTDPFNPDSDKDGFTDGDEVKNGFDPRKKGDGKGSDRLVSATPEPTATPIDLSQPSPTPFGGSGGFATPNPTPLQTGTQAQLVLIPISQLKITSATSPTEVKAYLDQIDALRPQELSDGQMVANAIQSAATGNTQPLIQVRTRIAQFAVALKDISTPKPAEEYQQLYVSLIQFTAQQLQIVEQNATGANQQRAVQAVLDIQNVLPSYVNRLAQLRQTVEGISNQ